MPRPSLSPQISARILEYVRDQNLQPGEHLPSVSLSKVFRVSRAPVNAALKELEQAKVVRFEPNRGYFLALSQDELAKVSGPPAVTSGEDELYVQLIEARLSGDIPDRTSEAELMRMFETSRPRLLKNLYRIAEEGWAERLPGNGWEFKPFLTSRAGYLQAHEFRASIECEALVLPTFKIDPEALEKVRAEQQAILDGGDLAMTSSSLFEFNTHFHETLISFCGNEFYVDALKRINRLRRVVEFRVYKFDRSRLANQAMEHLELLRLIESERRSEAAIFLRAHILKASALKSTALA